VTIFTTLVGAGGLGYAYNIARAYAGRSPRGVRANQVIDASIITVARARDELEEDNLRIRATLAEERKNWISERERFERERQAWETDRTRLRAEIAALEQRIVEERASAAARYDALLSQVQHLRQRTDEEKHG
jgi:septal ring factor EnvC (AmiA/AmiB activator)